MTIPSWLCRQPSTQKSFARVAIGGTAAENPIYPALSHLLQSYFSRALSLEEFDLPREAAVTDAQINPLLTFTKAGP
ncbi:MAG: hypothetical protein U0361_07835 [Nitrospiraceae bacterium]